MPSNSNLKIDAVPEVVNAQLYALSLIALRAQNVKKIFNISDRQASATFI